MDNYKQMKKVQTIIVSCMIFFIALIGVTVISFVQMGKVRKQNARYDELIAQLKQEQSSLTSNIEHIQSADYLEEKARNEFGMIKEGETLYIFK